MRFLLSGVVVGTTPYRLILRDDLLAVKPSGA